MNKRLDDLLAKLAVEPVDNRLNGLEANVMLKLDQIRVSAAPPAAWLIAASVISLGIGTFAGGTQVAAAPPADAMAVFSPQAALAPSNLLGSGF